MKEIADALQISEKTVEFHKYHIMKIFNLRSTAELVLFCPPEWLDFPLAVRSWIQAGTFLPWEVS
jgi:hypothetical protein